MVSPYLFYATEYMGSSEFNQNMCRWFLKDKMKMLKSFCSNLRKIRAFLLVLNLHVCITLPVLRDWVLYNVHRLWARVLSLPYFLGSYANIMFSDSIITLDSDMEKVELWLPNFILKSIGGFCEGKPWPDPRSIRHHWGEIYEPFTGLKSQVELTPPWPEQLGR